MLALTPPRVRSVASMGASVSSIAPQRAPRQPLYRRSRPLCVAAEPEVLTGGSLDAAIKAQGEAVRGLKEAQAPKAEVDAAVSRLLELKALVVASGPVELPTNENSPQLLRVRHTSAHILAMATQKLFPQAQVTIGPWIDNGFYYDFDAPEQFTPADLKKILKEMQKIVKRKLPLRREEVSREEARARIEKLGEPYKLELLDAIKTEPITIYHVGDEWWDLCAGPHVENTAEIDSRALSLDSVAGAYWRGDEKRQMLQRIYGTAWESKDQLEEYQRRMEEAKRRDHRLLGKKLNLFSIQPDAGGGLVFWHPKGARIRRIIEDFWKDEHVADGYELLYTPHVANLNLWKTSGHFDFYKEGMFDQMDVEQEQYQIKPMNCPFHVLVRAHLRWPGGCTRAAARCCFSLLARAHARAARPALLAAAAPAAPADLQGRPALLQGAAAALGRAGHRLPLRALGHAARADARARLHAGRRAHLLPARAALRRDPRRPRPHGEDPLALRLRQVRGQPLDAPGEERR